MPESALSRFKDEVIDSEAADRFKEELRGYLEARARKAVTDIGTRLGDGIGGLAESGGGAGALLGGLAKGGRALSEGKSPGAAIASAGVSHLKDTLKEKVKGLFGKGRKGGGGKSRSVAIVEDIDVGVPVREAYDQWTQFQEFSTFAKGVVSVEKSDDVSSNWKVKVAKSTRSWKANVTEQVPDERITWTTEGAKGTVRGVVTFHPLQENLTRVLLVLEYFPKGLFEKTGNIWRAQGRRARLDLKLYRKFVMLRGEATDGWRGEIRDGEVVKDHDEAIEEEEREREEADARADSGDGEEEFEDHDGEPADEDEEFEDDDGSSSDSYDDEASSEDEFEDEDELYDDEPEEDGEPEPAPHEGAGEDRTPARRSRRRTTPARR
jgi:uncharacterized membrane protein